MSAAWLYVGVSLGWIWSDAIAHTYNSRLDVCGVICDVQNVKEENIGSC